MKVYLLAAGNFARWTGHKAGAAHYEAGWHEFPDWYAESLVDSGHAVNAIVLEQGPEVVVNPTNPASGLAELARTTPTRKRRGRK